MFDFLPSFVTVDHTIAAAVGAAFPVVYGWLKRGIAEAKKLIAAAEALKARAEADVKAVESSKPVAPAPAKVGG